MPTGKLLSRKSSGQPAPSARSARAPETASPTSRCETSTRLWGTPLSPSSIKAPSAPSGPPSAIKSHSSGPSQSAARSPKRPAAPSRAGSSAPKTAEQAERAASPPRKTKRPAGASSRSVKPAPAGRAASSSGKRGASHGPGVSESDMQAHALAVVEAGRRDRRSRGPARGRDMQLRADAGAAALDKRKRDRSPEGRAEIGRRDVTERRRAPGRRGALRRLRPLLQHDRRILG